MAERYPSGMHGAIAAGLSELLGEAVTVSTATQDQSEHGLTEEVLTRTDVHVVGSTIRSRRRRRRSGISARPRRNGSAGAALRPLLSKIFRRLMGTTCSLAWRNSRDTELVWSVNPSHPITAGVPQPILINEHEMYSEFFDIPAPDELIFLSTFSSGEVFRSGCCWRRGKGKVFYFSPGDQEYPVTTTLTSSGCWPTQCGGPGLSKAPTSQRRWLSTSQRHISTAAVSPKAYAHERQWSAPCRCHRSRMGRTAAYGGVRGCS